MAGELSQIQLRIWEGVSRASSLESQTTSQGINRQTSAGSSKLRSNFHCAQLRTRFSPSFTVLESAEGPRRRLNVECVRADKESSTSDECGPSAAAIAADAHGHRLLESHGTSEPLHNAEMAITSDNLRKESSNSEGQMLLPDAILDWRTFRSRLCSSELLSSSVRQSNNDANSTTLRNSSNKRYWAHRISTPEVGCVLVATDKLKHHAFLREAVVLVLGLTDGHCHGILLNKSMPFSAHMVQGTTNQALLLDLAGCPKYVGGPLPSTPTIHVLSTRKGADGRGFSTLMPGLAVGTDAALPSLVSRVSNGQICKQAMKVYVGQMEWNCRHLFAEVFAFEWWDVAACGSAVLEGASSDIWQNLRSLYG